LGFYLDQKQPVFGSKAHAGWTLEPRIQSRALRRASWGTVIDTNDHVQRQKSFSRQRRAFVSALYTESYFPMALAMGYSLSQSNNLPAQNAEMVLFVRKRANISTSALDKLQRVGWKIRIEEDIVLPTLDIEQINPWHKWNLNKLQCWSWTEYDQILFIDSDSLVKADLSEVWNTPGGTPSPLPQLIFQWSQQHQMLGTIQPRTQNSIPVFSYFVPLMPSINSYFVL
jgi:alpha-N-acetylglucosamine transferase